MSEWTPRSLGASLGLPVRGEPDRPIHTANALEAAGPADLAWIGSHKFFAAGLASGAGCLIAPPEFEAAPHQTVLISPHPRAHFAQSLALLYPPDLTLPGIHATAIVHAHATVHQEAEIGPFVSIEAGAKVGARARIGQGCFIGRGASIGHDCILHPGVSVYQRVSIGPRCVIHSGAVLGADGFGFEKQGADYRKFPQVGTVEIGGDVEIGANTCIDRATLGATSIGDGTKLDNMVHIAHNCRIGCHVVIAAQTGLAGGVVIEDNAVIGGQVGVGDKVRIEAGAIVGSGAGILTSKIVRAGEPVWGTPARPLRQYLKQLALLARLSKK